MIAAGILLPPLVMAEADPRQTTGKRGESLARAELERRGYEIVATGFRTRYGEIDIIARDAETLVFVEVRARRGSDCGTAAESVTRQKQWKVSRAAAAYLAANGGADRPCRFDVVAIDYDLDGRPAITVYPNAFESCY